MTRPLPGRLVLLGHPVAHSLSPTFQNAALAAAGLSLRYEAVDVAPEALVDVLESLRADRAAGNVTVPHKEAVAAQCEVLTPLAARVGAVNTFWVDAEGRLVGDNTDVGGFDRAARDLLDDAVADAIVVLLGAGGAASAVCEAVHHWPGTQVRIVARTRERADRLVERYAAVATVWTSETAALEGARLLVNATPLGLEGGLMPVAPGTIPDDVAVMDLTYRRGRTPWIQSCRARGLRCEDGLPMLIEQGALAFERWFGMPANREAMWESVRR